MPSQKTLRLDASNPRDILRAAEILRNNGTVAFPTETVYGLGANALSPEAVEKIFIAKQRPHWDPLIVHIADRSQLPRVNEKTLNSLLKTTELLDKLIATFWPGPLTLLLPRTAAIPDAVTAGRPLVGVRIPNHPVAQALLQAAALPIAAPSANTFGHTSPTTAAHVLADLDGRIDAILDGGATQVGLESTVAEVSPSGITIYRPGAITLEMLEATVSPTPVMFYRPEQGSNTPAESLPSPGVGIRHYAPRARLILVLPDADDLEHSLLDAMEKALADGHSVGAMLPDAWGVRPLVSAFYWGAWSNPNELANRLFSGLRSLDDRGMEVIVCPIPTGDGFAAALRDRLEKAAR